MRLNLADPIRLNRASVAASYSPITGPAGSSERLHVEAEYERYDWRGHAAYNKADFYDLVGPTKTGRGLRRRRRPIRRSSTTSRGA